MAIKGRQTLYSIFVNGAIPTQKDYRDLIDSALNRRDDHFFGQWQKGMKYCIGDVVIYGKALYKLIVNETEEPCPPEVDTETTDLEDGCYCSLIEPPFDDKNWCVLELDMKDKDWVIICEPEDDPDGIASIIYQMTAKVGIGTEDPKALLDLTNLHKILVEPNADGNPTIGLQKRKAMELGGSEKERYVKYQLTEEVCWETDAPAYVFKLDTEEPATSLSKSATAQVVSNAPPLLLMKVTTNPNKVPQVGIGTAMPKGGLHVRQANRGQVLLNPVNHQEPGVLIINLEQNGSGFYSLTGINNDFTYFATNATGGFRFKKDDMDSESLMDCHSTAGGTSLMAILGDGRVGVGTEDPKSNVEITDGKSGAIRFQLGNDDKSISNPSISLNNLRPHIQQPNSYLALGVDDDYGIIVSDAPSGLVVKRGGPYGQNNNEVNVNQGKGVFFISTDGKTGIKTNTPPEDYDLDVHGQIRSMTAYLETSSKTIEMKTDLKQDNVLEKLEKLRPIRFLWKDREMAGNGDQIGFMAQNVYEFFPELVKKTGPDEKAVAYGNLTAVLVQAIQDQQKMIKELDERICDLEEKIGRRRD